MKYITNHTQVYPWQGDNAFELLKDGEQFYPAMLGAIEQAQHTILFEFYLVESGLVCDRFIDALLQAAQRGVRVYIIIDDMGGDLLKETDRQRLQHHHLHLLIYNPLRWRKVLVNMYRDHRKQLSIDGQLSFTGGMGISDVFSQEVKGAEAWRETAILIRGPVVNDWQQAFVEHWQHWHDHPISLPPSPGSPQPQAMRGRLVMTSGGQQLALKRSLIQAVRNAQQRIWLTTAYFMPSRKLRRELRRADQRGVDVRLLLPGAKTDHPSARYIGSRFYHRLLRDGVRIFEYQPRFLHVKQAICDDWVSIGSANYDRWSLRLSLEANQEIDDARIASQARELFLQDIEQSEEILFQHWLRRPLRQRLREIFWGWVDRLLEALHHRRKLERRNPFRRRPPP
ncbi:MAG: phosphatidylserine/phosphatidylglycerophosphate/cardiolipin synthase family protein [Gammaproteobacteria bacterium]|nr:phosphatidylserine/phosphatidylglycerophosphate/cardiolipin synthase family protein [Gammaproteobacteria bacterium]